MVRDQAAESGPSPPRICRRRWRLQIQRLVFDRLAASSAAHPGLVLLKLLQPGRANALMADKEVKTDPRNGR